ncbi:unnamed protein product [Cuscuta epithymum]|uniref:Integrase catalytic domain-containing protein n=1 Tax=Cuscuta epithymum TaxID=186058 RepID=A0AAV0CWP4_9ASTE|nr:unnamed protein product [Cuscuta epithymum]
MWHQCLGHPSENIITCLPFVSSSKQHLSKPCDVCFKAKQTHDSFPLGNSFSTRIFELIHCDLWGPYETPSSCGAKYFLTIVDDFSRAVWIYLFIDKKEIIPTFAAFFALVNRQFSQQVKPVRNDNGTEFNGMKPFFCEQGIISQTSCVGMPQQNGRVERKHRHILTVARALRFQSHLPISFWGECVLVAAHLINRTPSRILHNKTPFEILFGVPPIFDHLRVFCCLCYAYNVRSKNDKFSSRTRKCIFVGYPFGKKGWTVFDLDTKEYLVSRDVKFFEHIFPFAPSFDIIQVPAEVG